MGKAPDKLSLVRAPIAEVPSDSATQPLSCMRPVRTPTFWYHLISRLFILPGLPAPFHDNLSSGD